MYIALDTNIETYSYHVGFYLKCDHELDRMSEYI